MANPAQDPKQEKNKRAPVKTQDSQEKKAAAKMKPQKLVKKQNSKQTKKARSPPPIPSLKGFYVITPCFKGTVEMVDGSGMEDGTMVRPSHLHTRMSMCTRTPSHTYKASCTQSPRARLFVAQAIVWCRHTCWGERADQERYQLSQAQDYTVEHLQRVGACTLAHAQHEFARSGGNANIDLAILAILRHDMRYVERAKELLAPRDGYLYLSFHVCRTLSVSSS